MTSSTVKSAERTLDVLSLLAAHLRPVPTMTIARVCEIPKSSAHHLLNVMKDRGWVIYYEADHAWGLGSAAFEAGSAYLRSAPLQRLGRPLLEQLSAATEMTSHLAVLHGQDVMYLEKEESPTGHVRLVSDVGVRLPAHLTAVGRSMLAHLSSPQLRAVYAKPPLVRRTTRGPVTVGTLVRELAAVRTRGYAYEVGLTTSGIACLAAAARTADGYPLAGVGVTFVAGQHTDAQIEMVAGHVCEAAGRLTELLGPRNRLHSVPDLVA